MKWLSAVLSASIVGVFAAFYLWTYTGQKSYHQQRDARLVASTASSLLDAAQAGEKGSRVDRKGPLLTVSGLAAQGHGYSFSLAQVLERVALPEAFKALLVAEEDGDVIAQHARVRLEGLRGVREAPADGDDKAESAARKAEHTAFALRPTLQKLRFGEARLLAFCHPAPLPPKPEDAKTEDKQGQDKNGPKGKQPATQKATDGAQSGDPRPDAEAKPPAAGETLVVCGLVDEARLEREAGAVSPLALACLLAVFALALLAPPFLKVQLLSRPQRLRFSDVFSVAVCQFLGLMILAGVVFGVAVYYGLAGLADAELRQVADQARKRLGAELTAIDEQLTRSDADARKRGHLDWTAPAAAPARPPRSPSPSPAPQRLANEGLLQRGLCAARPATAAAPDQGCTVWPIDGEQGQPYPFFETLAWIAPDGEQRLKWWTGASATVAQSFFNVARRSYFSDARDDLLWRSSKGSGWPAACVMASVRAWSNGEVRAVYARPAATPSPAPQAKDSAPKVVQALTTRLLSLDAPVLPAGTGLAVIDARGDVLFHSDARLSRTHNLFEETAENPRLRAAVTARAADTLVARYWGRPHSLHVEPLGPLPWSLVAFREHEWLRAVGVEALSEALLLAVAFTLLFLLLSLAYIAVAGRRTPFPWARPEMVRTYVHLSGTFLVIGALYLGGLARCHGVDALVLAAALPLAVVLAAGVVFGGLVWLEAGGRASRTPAASSVWLLLTIGSALLLMAGSAWFARTWWGLLLGALTAALLALALALLAGSNGGQDDGSPDARFARHWRFWHRLASSAFWLLFSVLPAVGFVKGATERALDAHAARSLTMYAQRLDARERALLEQYPAATRVESDMRQRRRDVPWDIYPGGLHRIEVRAAEEECAAAQASAPRSRWAWVEQRLADWKPLLSEDAIALRHARVPHDEHGRPLSHWSLCTSRVPFQVVKGGPPTFRQVAGVWPWLVLLALAAGVVLSVRWSESALFVTHAVPPVQRLLGELRRPPAGARLAVLTPSSFERRDLRAGDWHSQVAAEATKPALIDLWDPAPDALKTLVALLAQPRRALVVLVPASSLSAWLADKAPADAREAWARALAAFEVVTARAPEPGDDDDAWDEQLNVWLGADAAPRVKAAVRTELGASVYVVELCQARLRTGELRGLDVHACRRRVEELAASYYASLWDVSSADERLTLTQIADEGFVNSRRLDALESLLARGLVLREPTLRLMNESFENFVRRREQAAPLAQAESAPAEAGFGWAQLRVPLFTLGVVTAAFIAVTERRAFESASGLSTLLVTTVIPLVSKAVTVMRGTPVADAESGGGGRGNA